ncbi:MAG: hypothetical protein J6L91_07730 [Clostridia bacterium]|nr:hypothetical protein [Clostridia bacterium]
MKSDFDGDIKIYQKKSDIEAGEFDGLVKDIDFHKANGNTEKARELGAKFASLKPTDEVLGILRKEDKLPAEFLYQARVLITFLCGRVTREAVDDQILSDFVRNAMYDYLKEHENGYYKNIADGAAYTFYRLAMKKGTDRAEEIGKEFAKMCSVKNDDAVVALGKKIYLNTTEHVKSLLDECDFKY